MSFFSEYAYPARGETLCTYLIALAAMQKGLQVSFIDNLAKTEYLKHCDGLGSTVLKISDGVKEYCFDRSRGELTKYESVSMAVNKLKTKEVLLQAGIPTPRGGIVEDKNIAYSPEFFEKQEFDKAVIKPVSGTQGRGVVTNITSQAKLEQVLEKYSYERFLLEEQVSGEEFRYYVADGRVVAVAGRDPANVVGNGRLSIRSLVREKNKERNKNPHLSSRLIKLDRIALNYLEETGKSPDYIPKHGEKVYVSPSANFSRGGDSVDATDLVSDISKRIAVKATEALKLPNAGVDIINCIDRDEEKSYVIEVNARAQIGSHTFPMIGLGQRNNVAEAIVDTYFPERKGKCSRGVFFDFYSVKKLMSEGAVSQIKLPVIMGSFVKRKLNIYSPDKNLNKFSGAIRKFMVKGCCYGEAVVYSDEICEISLFGNKNSIEEVRNNILSLLGERGSVEVTPMKGPISLKFSVRSLADAEYNLPYKAKYVFTGKVQGVGFRKWMRSKAISLNVSGWVRNESDGSLVAVFSAKRKKDIMKLVGLCEEGPKKALVDGVEEIKINSFSGEGFRIRKTS